jgi:uncharacterized iron-regulated membrane protein
MPGWRSLTLTSPPSSTAPTTLTPDGGMGGAPHQRAELQLDRTTGREVRWQPFSALTPGRRVRSVMRFAHTGEVLGLPGQTVAGIATAGSVVLVWTGIALALRRGRAWLGRRSKAAAGAPARVPQPEAAGPLSAASLNRVEESQS